MAKSVNNLVLDASLEYLRDNVTRMVPCSAEPTSFDEANNGSGDAPPGFALADVTLAPADFTIADGDTSGRKVSVAAKNGVSVDITGTVNHVALLDVANSRLLYVTTTAAQGVSSGGTVDLGGWDIELADPT